MAEVSCEHGPVHRRALDRGLPDVVTEPPARNMAVGVHRLGPVSRLIFAVGSALCPVGGVGVPAMVASAFGSGVGAEGTVLVLPPMLVGFCQAEGLRAG